MMAPAALLRMVSRWTDLPLDETVLWLKVETLERIALEVVLV